MKRLLLLTPIVLVALVGCRDDPGGAPAPQQPGATMQHQLDDIESTLDSIESELNGG